MSYTPAQRRGVTDTGGGLDSKPEPVGEQVSVEQAVYGEIEAMLPGKGEPASDCGEYEPVQFCDSEHHVHFGEHLCGRRECPRCWSGQWAGPRTVNVVSRLAAARYANEYGLDRRIVHGMFSPPEGEVESVSPMFRNRKKAVEVAREHGVRGGVVVVHPYRPLDETKDRFQESDYGRLWKFIRENDRHWYGQVEWSPHYHVIGLCRDFMTPKKLRDDDDSDVETVTEVDEDGEETVKRADGWVAKNQSTGEGVEPNPEVGRRFSPFSILSDPEPYDEMISVVRYLLSHTAVVKNRQAVTWFGSLHSTNFCPDPEAASERKTEPELGPLKEKNWEKIRRTVEELTGQEESRGEEEGAGEEESEECSEEGCGGKLHPIWDVPAYIDQRGDDLSQEALVRLGEAFSWAVGDVEEMPVGGWPAPRSEEGAQEAFEELVA